jgi:lysophospholipase L1-like esterase
MLRRLITSAMLVFITCAALVAEGKTVKIACVGDSITEGYGIPAEQRKELCWPSVLQKILGKKYKVQNFGACGRTLIRCVPDSWVKTGYPQLLAKFKPDIIVMMLGTNDSQGKIWKYKEHFEKDLRQYIAEYRKINRRVKIYICLPPPTFSGNQLKLSGTNYSSALIRDEIIPIMKKVAKEEKIPVIDTFNHLKDNPDYFADGVHPNIKGADAIAKFIASELKLKK